MARKTALPDVPHPEWLVLAAVGSVLVAWSADSVRARVLGLVLAAIWGATAWVSFARRRRREGEDPAAEERTWWWS